METGVVIEKKGWTIENTQLKSNIMALIVTFAFSEKAAGG